MYNQDSQVQVQIRQAQAGSNAGGNAFYQALGFINIGTETGKKRPLIVWRLELEEADTPR
jgi:hypothetical protein